MEWVGLQQPSIRYRGWQGNDTRYTGDLLVRFHEQTKRRPLVIECKYASALKEDPDLVKKLNHVGPALNREGYDFVVQTEHVIRASDLRMMRFVFDHINNEPDPAASQILACVTAHRTLRVGELIKAVSADTIRSYQLIPEVWRLVARRHLRVDFKEILDLSAKISLPSV